ncbi:MAG: response regulator, partial [Flavobacterium sp.]
VDLLEAEGHEVAPARNGTEALEIWERQPPDLVLLDIMMPGASGYEVCRTIRRQDRHTPVIFLFLECETNAKAAPFGSTLSCKFTCKRRARILEV